MSSAQDITIASVSTEAPLGTIRFDPERRLWLIKCQPHVTMRMKRVFGRLSKSSHGTLSLHDSIETARDLEWFCERYPLKVEGDSLKYLRSRAQDHKKRQEAVARVLSSDYVPSEFRLALPPRRYQAVAAELVMRSGGALIADDVGLGKTVIGICTMTDPRALPALVVTLTHLPRQWEAELKRFLPGVSVHILKSGKPYDIAKAMNGRRRVNTEQRALPGVRSSGDGPDVIICNYHKLSGWADALAGKVRSVIFDEVQELRHDGSAKYSAAKHIAHSAEFRTGLSATPIYNYGGEMFHVLDVLRPGVLGDESEFMREWCSVWGEKASVREPKAFGAYLRNEGLMLRRTREDVGRELPELTKVPHHVDADPEALDRIEGNAAELARVILAQTGLERGAKFKAAEELSYLLRQATGIAKAPYVAEFVRLLVESGEKVVLYGWHRDVYSIWMDRLKDFKPVMFTGSESPTQKEAAKQAFLDDSSGSKVLIMSLRAGAGLDGLQGHCRTVVFGELDWSPGVHEQNIGRVHRDGQRNPVVAYFLIADSGSDPVVADVLGLKKAQIEGMRDPDADLIEKLDTGGSHVNRLAEAYLAQRGITSC